MNNIIETILRMLEVIWLPSALGNYYIEKDLNIEYELILSLFLKNIADLRF